MTEKIGTVPLDPATREPLLLQTKWGTPYEVCGWRACCVSILLAAANRERMEPAVDELYFRSYLTHPELMLVANRLRIVEILRAAGGGLHVRKARYLQLFTSDFLSGMPVRECFGAGPYAQETLDLLVAGTRDAATDYALEAWAAWHRATHLPPSWGWGEREEER